MPYHPAPQLAASNLALFDAVEAADFPQAVLRYRNERAARSVGLESLSDDEWVTHFGRFTPLPDNQPAPLALRYHGHQFRQYNADLGDGRGFLFAQMYDAQGRLLDLGTKGSGKTPYSRGGDGRLTLKGGVREVLATAMLEALGVPTSKTFSLIETGEALHRGDEPSPTRSAVLVRLSHSHIRFGTFERLSFFGDATTMGGLIDFLCANYFLDIAAETLGERTALVYARAVETSARLAARWMAAGFVHGVLNTDNMNITGESFDYGPYRFLPRLEAGFTAAYFDHSGLYAFGRQPDAVYWNLAQLGNALTLIADSEAIQGHFNAFEAHYVRELSLAICQRLNLAPQGVDIDSQLIPPLFAFLGTMTFDGSFEGVFYDWFGGVASETRAKASPRADHYQGEAFEAFYAVLRTYQTADLAKLDHPRLAEADPETLLIDEIEAIWAQIAESDDWSALYAKLDRIEIWRQALGLTPSS